MKFRIGFVSNSSSSSFVLSFPHEIKKVNDLEPYFDSLCYGFLKKEVLMDYFFKDMDEITIEDLKYEFDNWNLNDKATEKYHQEYPYTSRYATLNGIKEFQDIKQDLLKKLVQKHEPFWKGRFMYSIEVEDHDNGIETAIHNSDGNFLKYDSGAEYLYFSHH